MIKLIIFDLDGTLLDTIEDIAQACNYALRQCGCPERSLSEFNSMIGHGIFNLFRCALPQEKRSEEMVRQMHSHFVPWYREHICDRTRPYPGIYEVLDTLAEKGISFAVASNKYQEGTELLTEKFFGRYNFRCVLGQRTGKPIKPDPEIINEILREAGGIKCDETVYCGDSDVDMQTGINAGVRTIGATWGFRSREELAAYSPWVLAEKTEDISEAILQENKIKA
jgi:phosphoglycolate phosphatase